LFKSDVQALAHAVDLSRQEAIDSLRYAEGDLTIAFKVLSIYENDYSYSQNKISLNLIVSLN
jgi:hypothetical protein